MSGNVELQCQVIGVEAQAVSEARSNAAQPVEKTIPNGQQLCRCQYVNKS